MGQVLPEQLESQNLQGRDLNEWIDNYYEGGIYEKVSEARR